MVSLISQQKMDIYTLNCNTYISFTRQHHVATDGKSNHYIL